MTRLGAKIRAQPRPGDRHVREHVIARLEQGAFSEPTAAVARELAGQLAFFGESWWSTRGLIWRAISAVDARAQIARVAASSATSMGANGAELARALNASTLFDSQAYAVVLRSIASAPLFAHAGDFRRALRSGKVPSLRVIEGGR